MSEVITYKCELKDGIHARPAGHIERLCNTFSAEVNWKNIRTGRQGSAKSALSLVATDTLLDDECEIAINGKDAEDGAIKLAALLKKLPDYEVTQEEETTGQTGYLPRSLRETGLSFTQGTRISGGVAIARPLIIQSLTFAEMQARNPGGEGQPQREIPLLLAGLETLKGDKQAALETHTGVEYDIIQAHLSIITDVAFQSSITDYIQQNNNAWAAVIAAAMDFCDILNSSSSKYLSLIHI